MKAEELALNLTVAGIEGCIRAEERRVDVSKHVLSLEHCEGAARAKRIIALAGAQERITELKRALSIRAAKADDGPALAIKAEDYRMTRATAERVAQKLDLMGRPDEYALKCARIKRNGRTLVRWCAVWQGRTVLSDAKSWGRHWTPAGFTGGMIKQLGVRDE